MKVIYKLDGLCCAKCADSIEKNVAKLDGVNTSQVGFMTQKLTIDITDDVNCDELAKSISKIVKKIEPDVKVVLVSR
jgi:copper chaperone CopZ